jgi:MraZ protein
LDDKGRVVLPSKFRNLLAGGCVVAKGQDACLYVYTMEGWAEKAAQISELPGTDRKARDFARALFGGAKDQEPDKQGRIVIPEGLLEYASLEKDVTVVGVANHIEIWSTTAWQAISEAADEFYSGIEEALSAGGEI